ncbi:MAG: bifunctional proline dehydrogenase/L-glutamate gamma-semialdehyde dehydrogenase PutA [Pseudomonadota bacterium]
MSDLADIRETIRLAHRADQPAVIEHLSRQWAPDAATRRRISQSAEELVASLRSDAATGLMESFLAQYGLSTNEGVALMCLAEALLRVPDAETIDALIEDKIAPSALGAHLGKSSSSLVNASTWALMLTGKVLDDDKEPGIVGALHAAVKRLGEPVIRTAVRQAMKELGRQFVLGQTMDEAMARAAELETDGYTYSYDMLGEAAMTAEDADSYFQSYKDAISAIAARADGDDIRRNPGISIKLSALHPRYDALQKDRVMTELVARTRTLVRAAKDAGVGLNIDAEEADRLDLSLDVIEAVMRSPELSGWDGFGVVVQAYGKRAAPVIDWLYALAAELDRKIMVRLVKGAYWDTEIKRAQIDGVLGFPVFTHKSATDISYICCAQKLLKMSDRIYPQFATHNAHAVAAILEMAETDQSFEFQRLHGMGEALHQRVMAREKTHCRIYAPVGAHRDLLAYLVRRLLENGANSSFVNQIVDLDIPAAEIAADPFETFARLIASNARTVRKPADLFSPGRKNATGWDLRDPDDQADFIAARSHFAETQWAATPLLAAPSVGGGAAPVVNPAVSADILGTSQSASVDDVDAAIGAASPWSIDATVRAEILRRASDLYEEHRGELFAILTREAGKSALDAISELREAIDFLRFYANEAERLSDGATRGVIACISPWNFPLAIFTGQISAALAAGNAVIAKPAGQTPIIAWRAVQLLHQAGVPKTALQLAPGGGSTVGAKITSDPRIDGVCFTGSTLTAQRINRVMAKNLSPDAPLIAETGGLNAMIVDSTALPEQAVRDILASAFQSAGQRCSALRMLYVQEDVAPIFQKMLFGAMDELSIGAPWALDTDVGPVIDAGAKQQIDAYLANKANNGAVLKQLSTPDEGSFVRPSVVHVDGIEDLEEEVFGPVLHWATYKAEALDEVLAAINASGYGLTFGMHSRIDDRVEKAVAQLRVGNIYINRNQIGAVVGSQPFGGEGLSGTGPKAGGPHYVARFLKPKRQISPILEGNAVSPSTVQALLDDASRSDDAPINTQDMPGPTGESNRLSFFPRGLILCLGPSSVDAEMQAHQAEAQGCIAVRIAPGAKGPNAIDGVLAPESLTRLKGVDGVAYFGEAAFSRAIRSALADRDGPLTPLMTETDISARCVLERHVCIDTTAAGGNAALMAATT